MPGGNGLTATHLQQEPPRCTARALAPNLPQRKRPPGRSLGSVTTHRRAALVLVALTVLVALAVLVGCGGTAGTSFDPQAPCPAEGKQQGAYPELEALVPRALDGAAPALVDSGRNCSADSLGTLARRGITEVRFAGATWELGERSGVTIALFRAPGLTTAYLAEFYENSARGARRTEQVTTTDFSIAGVAGRRLDTLNDESFQTVVVLDANEPDTVRAVLVASDVREIGTRDAHDERVDAAAAAAVGVGER